MHVLPAAPSVSRPCPPTAPSRSRPGPSSRSDRGAVPALFSARWGGLTTEKVVGLGHLTRSKACLACDLSARTFGSTRSQRTMLCGVPGAIAIIVVLLLLPVAICMGGAVLAA